MTSRLLRLAPLALALLFAPALRADDAAELAALQAADDERAAAILAADPARLDAIFSDGLQYTHSSGHFDTKQSYMETLVSKKTVYQKFDYRERHFTLVAPDIALERAHVIIQSINGTTPVTNDLAVLAVWRKEAGRWRFLAWQAAKRPPPAAK